MSPSRVQIGSQRGRPPFGIICGDVFAVLALAAYWLATRGPEGVLGGFVPLVL
jgi:hypothetical protein